MFASYTNNKFINFTSWGPAPLASRVDMFTFTWGFCNPYCFPPFNLILRTLHHPTTNENSAVMLLPPWTTAHWFPTMLQLLTVPIFWITPTLTCPTDHLTREKQPPPNCKKMFIVSLSGNSYRSATFRESLPRISSSHVRWSPTRKWDVWWVTRWYKFCLHGKVDPVSPTEAFVGNFIIAMSDATYALDTIERDLAALSCLFDLVATKVNPFKWNFSKAHLDHVYRKKHHLTPLRLTRPSKAGVWDPSLKLNYLEGQPINNKLSLPTLARKIVMLIMLSTMRLRVDLLLMNVNKCMSYEHKCIFTFMRPAKTVRHTNHNKKSYRDKQVLTVREFPLNPHLCPLQCLTLPAKNQAPERPKYRKSVDYYHKSFHGSCFWNSGLLDVKNHARCQNPQLLHTPFSLICNIIQSPEARDPQTT